MKTVMNRQKTHIFVALVLMTTLLASFSCAQPSVSAPLLQSPQNGSTVSSLTPILTWTAGTADASYRIQLATDSNFQNLLVDEANIAGESYSVPSGKLLGGETVYWKVRTYKGNQSSSWSPFWSFLTPGEAPAPTPPSEPGKSTISIKATWDGDSWQGNLGFNLGGPQSLSGTQVPQQFVDVAVGTYTLTYGSGGPANATLASITPDITQTTVAGTTTTFTLNFSSEPTTAIRVSAKLDGVSWSGDLLWRGSGPEGVTEEFDEVPETFSNLQTGTYSVSYIAGGPSDSTLVSITPQQTQEAIENSTTNFIFNFVTDETSNIRVRATLNGKSWSGSVNYTISGPTVIRGNRVSRTHEDLPVGTYTLTYDYGGPSDAILQSITPQPTQTTIPDSTTTFTLNFYSVSTSLVRVRATLDGSSWSGDLVYEGSGPQGIYDRLYTVPDNFPDFPAGAYSVNYLSGGPPGAQLIGISPSAIQTVGDGERITFTFNFMSVAAATGRISVDATLDGILWQGPVRFNISGPASDSGRIVPDQFSNFPEGPYTLTYLSGGPPSSQLLGISPGPLQVLSPGGRIRFTLRFGSLVAVPLPEIPPIEPIETVPMPLSGGEEVEVQPTT